MLQSTILRKLNNLFYIFKNAYYNSFFHNFFCKTDKFFSNTTFDSSIIKTFLRPCNQNYSSNSKLFQFTKTFSIRIKTKNDILVKWILNSKFIGLILSIAAKLERTPFKIIGLFGTAFLLSNIIYQLLFKGFSYIIILKIFVLIGFIMLSRIEISFKRALRESYIFKLVRKIAKSSGESYV